MLKQQTKMVTNCKLEYLPPVVRVVRSIVENGFALSRQDGFNTSGEAGDGLSEGQTYDGDALFG